MDDEDDDGYTYGASIMDDGANDGGDVGRDDEPRDYDPSSQIDGATTTTNGNDDAEMNLDEGYEPVTNEVMMLKKAWVQERLAPELLEYKALLVDAVKAMVDAQERAVEERERAAAEGGGDDNSNAAKIINNLLWVELNRVKYLLREYMRTRLRKIETYAWHLYTTPDAAKALGPAEKKYLEAYLGAVFDHMQSALEVLPEGYKNLLKEYDAGEEEEAEWMKPKPDLDSLVFFRFRQDVNNYLAPGDDEPVDIARGNIVMAKYSMFKPLTEMDPPMAELT